MPTRTEVRAACLLVLALALVGLALAWDAREQVTREVVLPPVPAVPRDSVLCESRESPGTDCALTELGPECWCWAVEGAP